MAPPAETFPITRAPDEASRFRRDTDGKFVNLDGSGPQPFRNVYKWAVADKLTGRRRKSPGRAEIPAVAVDPNWSMLLWTLALFLVVEPVVGHVIEPMVYGHSTGLSPVAVVASAAFWTALWGPIGLVLAAPLTVCLVVLGRHVERLEFLDIMFGDRPALSPPAFST